MATSTLETQQEKRNRAKLLQRTAQSPTSSTISLNAPVPDSQAIVQRAMANPSNLLPNDVLHLQRSMGNRAVSQMLQRQTVDKDDTQKVAGGGQPIVQRYTPTRYTPPAPVSKKAKMKKKAVGAARTAGSFLDNNLNPKTIVKHDRQGIKAFSMQNAEINDWEKALSFARKLDAKPGEMDGAANREEHVYYYYKKFYAISHEQYSMGRKAMLSMAAPILGTGASVMHSKFTAMARRTEAYYPHIKSRYLAERNSIPQGGDDSSMTSDDSSYDSTSTDDSYDGSSLVSSS